MFLLERYHGKGREFSSHKRNNLKSAPDQLLARRGSLEVQFTKKIFRNRHIGDNFIPNQPVLRKSEMSGWFVAWSAAIFIPKHFRFLFPVRSKSPTEGTFGRRLCYIFLCGWSHYAGCASISVPNWHKSWGVQTVYNISFNMNVTCSQITPILSEYILSEISINM